MARQSRQAVLLLLVMASAAGGVWAQSGAEGGRGSPPIGQSRDGSRPAEGALKGGAAEPDADPGQALPRDVSRCRQLKGELGEQCLRDLEGRGEVRKPSPTRGAVPRDPVKLPRDPGLPRP